jgi:electron transfer flavoprotein beta subunit
VKQVPDTAHVTADAMKDDGTVNRSALPAIFNPEDLLALEAALDVRDRYGGSVTALTMGPPKAADVLRECLYRGADRVILLTDRRAAASDTLATSYILSRAIRRVGQFDLVFCGRQAIDGDTAQVGPQCAEKLGIPQITYVEEIIQLCGEVMEARRATGRGWERIEVRLPALVTVPVSAPRPRPPSARRVMRLKRARTVAELAAEHRDASAPLSQTVEAMAALGLLIDEWSLDDIAADLGRCGLAGSPTKVHRIQSLVLTKDGHTQIPATEAGVRGLIHELIVDRTLG